MIYAGPCTLRPRAFAVPQSPLIVISWQCFPSLTDFFFFPALSTFFPTLLSYHLAAPPWNTLAFSGLPSEDIDFLSSSSPSPSRSRLPRSSPPACGSLKLTDRSLSFCPFTNSFINVTKATKGNSEHPGNSHTSQGRRLSVEGHAGNLNTHKAEAGHGRLQGSLWHTVRTVLGWQVWGPASLAPLRHYLVNHFGPSLLPAFPRDLQSQLETLDLYSKTAFPHLHLCSQVIFSDLNNTRLILSLLDYAVLL